MSIKEKKWCFMLSRTSTLHRERNNLTIY